MGETSGQVKCFDAGSEEKVTRKSEFIVGFFLEFPIDLCHLEFNL